LSKLYFVRHGETVWNMENKICGATDSPLTKRGREQARETDAAAVDEFDHVVVGTAVAVACIHADPARVERMVQAARERLQKIADPADKRMIKISFPDGHRLLVEAFTWLHFRISFHLYA